MLPPPFGKDLMESAPFLTRLTMLGCAVLGGVFFAFSSFVTKGLTDLPARQGMRAMQRINRRALRPLFLGAFVGTALLSILEVMRALFAWETAGAGARLMGALLYLSGAFLLTILYHVPRNERLDSLDPETPEGAAYWERYGREWLRWNHVRTFACILAAALLSLG